MVGERHVRRFRPRDARIRREGYKLIMGDAFAAEQITRRVAREYPKVAFVFGSGSGRRSPISPCSTTGSTSRPISPA